MAGQLPRLLAFVEPLLIPRLDDLGGAPFRPNASFATLVQAQPATGFATSDLLPVWAGALVAGGYAGAFALARAVALRGRDIV